MSMPTPAEMATWPAPNYIDPETRRALVLGIEIPLMVLVIAFLGCRLYSRTVIVRAIGKDDWVMLAAGALQVTESIIECVSTLPTYQTGYHIWDMKPQTDPSRAGKLAMAVQITISLICGLTKISILLTYLRIFPSKNNKRFCYVLMVIEIGWCLANILLVPLQCTPIEAYWDPLKYPERKCLNTAALYYTMGAWNVLTDFLIFLWPIQDLAAVRISFRQRITLITMFCIGVIACVAGVCRLWYLSVFLRSYDTSWHGAALYAIVAIESSLGIVCGCLPGCKPLMTELFPRIFESTHNAHSQKKPSKLDGQPFPFQSLRGVIITERGYRVEYGHLGSQSYGKSTLITAGSGSGTGQDRDAVSAHSQEWVMTQDRMKDSDAQVEGNV